MSGNQAVIQVLSAPVIRSRMVSKSRQRLNLQRLSNEEAWKKQLGDPSLVAWAHWC